MQTPAIALIILLSVSGLPCPAQSVSTVSDARSAIAQDASVAKQLLAVRGEVIKIKAASKGWLQLTIKPPKDYPEVSVMARENDRVGSAINRSKDSDLLGLLSESEDATELFTAAEIEEGDFVSVIYDPQAQNRALEIYLR